MIGQTVKSFGWNVIGWNMIGHTVTTPELQQEIKIKTVLDRQLSHIRNEINTTYTDSFVTIKNSKRAGMVWEFKDAFPRIRKEESKPVNKRQ